MLCKGGQVKLIDTPHNQGCQCCMLVALALHSQSRLPLQELLVLLQVLQPRLQALP